jgi:hypothetical protein
MMTRNYDITEFKWQKGLNSFFLQCHEFSRSQFIICNTDTCNFRRFRLHRELQLLDGSSIMKFRSEDQINCFIFKTTSI